MIFRIAPPREYVPKNEPLSYSGRNIAVQAHQDYYKNTYYCENGIPWQDRIYTETRSYQSTFSHPALSQIRKLLF